MGKKIINIIAKDGCFYQDEVDANLSNKQVAERVLETACKPIKEIFDEHFNLIWRERLTVKDGKNYRLKDLDNVVNQFEQVLNKLGKFEDEEEESLGF